MKTARCRTSFLNAKSLFLIILISGILAALVQHGPEPFGSSQILAQNKPASNTYIVVDTGQSSFFDSKGKNISAPGPGQSGYGQDPSFNAVSPNYKDNGDGTVSDLNTGLMWQKDPGPKKTWAEAVSGASQLRLGGYTDWRLPTIKELYSLFDAEGTDPSGFMGKTCDTGQLTPYIDTQFFKFTYGNQSTERVIDSQYWSATDYLPSYKQNSPPAVVDLHANSFGVNFADGRIKAYPQSKANYVIYVRGNTAYGINNFNSNGDGTVSDQASGLMWMQGDSGGIPGLISGSRCKDGRLDWSEALNYAQNANSQKLFGYSDWRLPNIKELQSIVDYRNSPDYNGKPAIDTNYFTCSGITNEAGQADFPYYWSGTNHISARSGSSGQYVKQAGNAMYIAFGRGLGYMHNQWMDIHGAGCQRSDPKWSSTLSYSIMGPQGDVRRTYNYVRLVRDGK